jgi:murein DD-endopeptidase MepM/ murein hydrolase activator NlpD
MAAKQWTDRWIQAVWPLAVVDAALFFSLQARPGRLGPVLWRWGPPLMVLAAAVLLALALASAATVRSTWSIRRGAALAALLAVVGSAAFYRTYPSSHDFSPSRVSFRLPLDGPVTVAWGGPRARTNYHVASPAERWGFDLLIARDGGTYRGEGRSPQDYYAYGQPVRAPATGRVIHHQDGLPDALPGHPDRLRGAGNHVILEVAPRQYLFVAHLREGSLRVTTGDAVLQGDVIGAVGNSGHSTEPHVHLHLQDSVRFDEGEAIPFSFSNVVLAGTDPPVPRPMPEGGMRRGRYVGDTVRSGN